MKLVTTFVLVFVAGPTIYWLLARRTPGKPYLAMLFSFAVVLVALAFGVAQWLVPSMAPSPYPGLGVILAMWLAWISVLALCVQAILLRLTSPTAKRITFALGAMATTLPWFGLYAAQMMTVR